MPLSFTIACDEVIVGFYEHSLSLLITDNIYSPLSMELLTNPTYSVISAPLSEIYGRKIVLLGTFPIFGLFTLGTGLAQNFATILICRFFAGVFGSTALAVGSGTSADIWPPKYSGVTYPFQMIAPFLGPTTGKTSRIYSMYEL